MNNLMYRLMAFQTSRLYRIMLVVLASLGVISMVAVGQGNAVNSVYCVYNTVETAIFILGLTLMILGGALYAGGNMLPSSQKGTAQGYGMGMIIGGVIGVIIAILAPYILQVISGNSAIAGGAGSVTCP